MTQLTLQTTRLDLFYEQLSATINDAPPHDIVIVLTDANASISRQPLDDDLQRVTGPVFTDTTTNDYGQRLLDLYRASNLCILDTWFPRKTIHKYTWYSNDRRNKKAMDHILISRQWKNFATNCHVFRGAELGKSDHRLLVADLRLKLKAITPSTYKPRVDSSLLHQPDIRAANAVSVTNRYSVLDEADLDTWEPFRNAVSETAESILGHRRRGPRNPWITNAVRYDSPETWRDTVISTASETKRSEETARLTGPSRRSS